ncbi:MAG: hypothetical protein GPJ50_09530 [Candidatus Heimdallarchaeota archaeon]|nr:hypothetical protein [Candidatus Heimdallarchaeota archaeon]
MKIKSRSLRKIFLAAVLILFLSSSNLNKSAAESENQKFSIYIGSTNRDNNNLFLTSTSHDPIVIDSDDDFISLGFSGLGTENEPYLIENYTITTTMNIGIKIQYTTKYFIVRNCIISAQETGISIDDVAERTAVIINNTCNNHSDFGIEIWDSPNATVVNNICSGNVDYGIFLFDDDFSEVSNNTCSYNKRGIRVSSSYSCNFTNNVCSDNDYGMHLFSTKDSNVINNTCSDNSRYGLYLEYGDGTNITGNLLKDNTQAGLYLKLIEQLIISNNTFFKNGFMMYKTGLDDPSTILFLNNTINGKKLGYFVNVNNLSIEEPDYGQLFCINCTNINFENQILTNASIGLILYSCTNVTITNNTCSYNSISGISMNVGGKLSVLNNNCSNNGHIGIHVDGESYISSPISSIQSIMNNTCTRNRVAIAIFYADGIQLINNTCNNNSFYGIELYNAQETLIERNNCSLNGNEHYYDSAGIYITDADSSVISNNIIDNNFGHGIYLSFSESCEIFNNLISMSELYGIYIPSTSMGSLIYHNSFASNGFLEESQGYNDGHNNIWYNELLEEGNWWSNWDHIKAYSIDGNKLSFDIYPLNFEGIPYSESTLPTIDHPSDFIYETGTSGHNITWNPYDLNPSHYIITRNDDLLESDIWRGEPIQISIDGMGPKQYEFVCKVIDLYGNEISDTVIVEVTSTHASNFEALMLPISILIIYLVKKKRKY